MFIYNASNSLYTNLPSNNKHYKINKNILNRLNNHGPHFGKQFKNKILGYIRIQFNNRWKIFKKVSNNII